MPLFGVVHTSLLLGIIASAVILSWLCRTGRIPAGGLRLTIGYVLVVNEFIWWVFRYSHEGVHLTNLPLQLCDLTVWMTALACIRPIPLVAEFAYFAGVGGTAMAILTPDLWTPWPSYPALYFFVAHGAVFVGCCVLVFGRIAPLRQGAVWRAFGLLLCYAGVLGMINAATGSNYMYLNRKPAHASLLDWFGPWPLYLVGGVAGALLFFWLLWLPARPSGSKRSAWQRRGC